MPRTKDNLPMALLRLKAVLLEDRRKALVLAILVAVGLVLAIRLLLGRNMPRRAIATPTAQKALVSPSAAPKTVDSSSALLSDNLANADTKITRDLFKVSVEAYPVVVSARPSETGKVTKLQLQSIVPGPRPTAIINGLVVGVGDAVKEPAAGRWVDTGFVVASIEEKACIVTQQGVAVRLEIKSDR